MQMQVNVYEECSSSLLTLTVIFLIEMEWSALFVFFVFFFFFFAFFFTVVRLQCLFPENKLSSIGNKWNYLATLAEVFSCFHKHHISILNIRFNYLLWRSFFAK